MMMLETLLDV